MESITETVLPTSYSGINPQTVEPPTWPGETQTEEEALNDLNQILELLQSPSFDPQNPSDPQLAALCQDIQALESLLPTLENSDLENDHVLAENIEALLNPSFGSDSLASAAAAYSPENPDVSKMRSIFENQNFQNSYSSFITHLTNTILYPFQDLSK